MNKPHDNEGSELHMSANDNMHGAVALVGSGEYLPQMEKLDRVLLETVGGPAKAHVVLIPTASGLEPGMPERWNTRGEEHFRKLGAKVTPLHLVAKEDAYASENVAAAREADFVYFSGGNPNYLVETLRDSPVWRAILERYKQGAVLAGCSAGAMMLGGYTISVRTALQGGSPEWIRAMGVVPNVSTIPHFDRMRRYSDDSQLIEVIRTAPQGLTVIGVDEDTAAVRLNGEWKVLGRQGVSVFGRDGSETRYNTSQKLPL